MRNVVEPQADFRSPGSSIQKVLDRYFRRRVATLRPFLTPDTRDGIYEAVVNGMGTGFVRRMGTGTGRNKDVKQLRLRGTDTSSVEVVFAPIAREMEILNALFGMIDGIELC